MVNNPQVDKEHVEVAPRVRASELLNRGKLKELASGNCTAYELTRKSSVRNLLFDDVAGLAKALEDQGFRRLSSQVRYGWEAFVYQSGEQQVVRISRAGEERNRAHIPQVLKPVFSKVYKKRYNIESLPFVHPLDEILGSEKLCQHFGLKDPVHDANAYVRQLIADCLHDGYVFFDTKQDNVGLVKDWRGQVVPIIIDADAVVKREELTDYQASKLAKHFLSLECNNAAAREVYPEAIIGDINIPADAVRRYLECLEKQQPHSQEDYKLAQYELLIRRGLDEGHTGNMVSRQQLEAFCEERKEYRGKRRTDGTKYRADKSLYVQMVEDDGLYPKEIGELVKEAADSHSADVTDNGTAQRGFCAHIQDARERHKDNSIKEEGRS